MRKKLLVVLAVAAMIGLAGCDKPAGDDYGWSNSIPTEMPEPTKKEEPTKEEEPIVTITVAPTEALESDTPDFYYEYKDDGTIVILDYWSDAEVVIIPEEIEGSAVTEIGEMAFIYDDYIHVSQNKVRKTSNF